MLFASPIIEKAGANVPGGLSLRGSLRSSVNSRASSTGYMTARRGRQRRVSCFPRARAQPGTVSVEDLSSRAVAQHSTTSVEDLSSADDAVGGEAGDVERLHERGGLGRGGMLNVVDDGVTDAG